MKEYLDIEGRTWRFSDNLVEFNGPGGNEAVPGRLGFDSNTGEMFDGEPFAFVDFGDGTRMAFYDDRAVRFVYIGPPMDFDIKPVFMRKR